MGFCLVGRGTYSIWNLLAGVGVVATPDNANANFPIGFLTDGNTAKPFRFNTDAADRKITFDLTSAKLAELLTIHGHNIGTGITFIELRYSTDNFVGDDNLAAKIVPLYNRAAMYVWVPGGFTKRYWRVVFKGTNGTAIWIGEMTLSSPLRLIAKPQLPLRVDHQEAHTRLYTPAGRREVVEKTAWETRYVAASFMGTLAARDEVVEQLYRANRGDLRPMLFLPRAPGSLILGGGGAQSFDLNENVVVFGHLEPPELAENIFAPALARWTIGVQEDPFTEPLA